MSSDNSLTTHAAVNEDIEKILDFENKKLKEQFANEEERTFESWKARWRKESLESYIKVGWSYIIKNETDELVGYFIAQPLLFFDGSTQSLWVEHLQYSTLQARDELCELAWRLCREKHFQKVYFPALPGLVNTLKSMRAESWSPSVMFIKTTKALS